MLPAVRATMRELDRSAVVEAKTMRDHLALAFFPSRMGALFLGSLGALGLLLAMVGLYGVMAYAVSRRRFEIGVRMALGASPGRLLWTVLREGLVLVGVGAVIGLVLAAAGTRVLRGFLPAGLSPTDPVSFAVITALLFAVGVAACLAPARRAMRVDPMEALRYE